MSDDSRMRDSKVPVPHDHDSVLAAKFAMNAREPIGVPAMTMPSLTSFQPRSESTISRDVNEIVGEWEPGK